MLVYSILESTSSMSFLEQAVWSKICALSILVPVSEHIFHWNFPSSHKPCRGCTYTHLLEMSFSVHTINHAPYYLCTFDKIKTGRNVRFVDMKLSHMQFDMQFVDLQFISNAIITNLLKEILEIYTINQASLWFYIVLDINN